MADRIIMESNNNGCIHQTEDEDRLSDLIDDILLSILERLDIFAAARMSMLSTRWRHLPRLLPELNLDVKDFLCVPCPNPIEAQHREQAMASLTKATRSFLVNPHNKCTVTRLSLKLYMISSHCDNIGSLVNSSIASGAVTELDLAIIDETRAAHCKDDDMLKRTWDLHVLFSDYPGMLHCLVKLYLTNVRFAEWDMHMHHLLFDCCKQLKHLTLHHCDNGDGSVWQINAPNSKLTALEIYVSHLERLDVLCLPKLERFHFNTWLHHDAPVRFGSIPSLKEVHLRMSASIDHREFSLSKVLNGATNIHTLVLNFDGEKLWIQPEIKQLWPAFKKLRKLSLHGIYVEFDLYWTMVVLEAAPSVEIFDIEIFEHPCLMNEERIPAFGEQPLKPSWKIPSFTRSNKWQLKEFSFVGFRPLEQQMSFVKAMMDRAPNLKTILLKEDVILCEDCEAMDTRPPPAGGTFPRDKEEQEAIVKHLRDGASSFAQIIFCS